MAGHSHAKNVMHKKSAQDLKNAKIAMPNSVMFLFEEKGVIECDDVSNHDEFLEEVMNLNVIDVDANKVYVKINDFYSTQMELEKKYKIINASIEFIANNTVAIEDTDALYNLLEKLEDYEEVESCWHNCKI